MAANSTTERAPFPSSLEGWPNQFDDSIIYLTPLNIQSEHSLSRPSDIPHFWIPRLSQSLSGEMQPAHSTEICPEYPTKEQVSAIFEQKKQNSSDDKYGADKTKLNKDVTYYRNVVKALKCGPKEPFTYMGTDKSDAQFKHSAKAKFYFQSTFPGHQGHIHGTLWHYKTSKKSQEGSYQLVVPQEEAYRLLCWAHFHGNKTHHAGRDRMYEVLSRFYNTDNFERTSVVSEFISLCTHCQVKTANTTGKKRKATGATSEASTPARAPRPTKQAKRATSASTQPIQVPQEHFSQTAGYGNGWPNNTGGFFGAIPPPQNQYTQQPVWQNFGATAMFNNVHLGALQMDFNPLVPLNNGYSQAPKEYFNTAVPLDNDFLPASQEYSDSTASLDNDFFQIPLEFLDPALLFNNDFPQASQEPLITPAPLDTTKSLDNDDFQALQEFLDTPAPLNKNNNYQQALEEESFDLTMLFPDLSPPAEPSTAAASSLRAQDASNNNSEMAQERFDTPAVADSDTKEASSSTTGTTDPFTEFTFDSQKALDDIDLAIFENPLWNFNDNLYGLGEDFDALESAI